MGVCWKFQRQRCPLPGDGSNSIASAAVAYRFRFRSSNLRRSSTSPQKPHRINDIGDGDNMTVSAFTPNRAEENATRTSHGYLQKPFDFVRPATIMAYAPRNGYEDWLAVFALHQIVTSNATTSSSAPARRFIDRRAICGMLPVQSATPISIYRAPRFVGAGCRAGARSAKLTFASAFCLRAPALRARTSSASALG